jgi:photosystem II stability/assembly factor-like uncharacterized protein
MKTIFVTILFCLLVVISTINLNAQWRQIKGPTMASIGAMMINDSNIFAATGHGVYRSTNRGMNWAIADSGLNNNGSFDNQARCFAASTDGKGGSKIFAGTEYGLFVSTNNGTSWTNVQLPTYQIWVESLAVNGSNIFVGTSDGVFLSTDYGTTWLNISSGVLQGAWVNSFVIDNNNIFVAANGGIFLSTNNGVDWSTVFKVSTDYYIRTLAINHTLTGTYIFAGTDYSGIYLSTNNGSSWTPVNSGLFGGVDVGVISFAISQDGSKIFAGTSHGVYFSTDNGSNWNADVEGLPSAFVRYLAIDGSDIYASFTYGGVYHSTIDGSSWTVMNSGMPPVHLNTFSLAMFGSDIIVGTDYMGVFSSADKGKSWMNYDSGLPFGFDIVSLAVKPTVTGYKIFAGTGGAAGGKGIYLSSNNGLNWKAVTSDLNFAQIYCLTVQDSSIYAGTDKGILLSKNDGTDWVNISSQNSNQDIHCLFTSGSTIYAGTDIGIVISTDNGKNWIVSDSGFTYPKIVNAILVRGTSIYAGTTSGVYVSYNNGGNWISFNTGLTDKNIHLLATDGLNVIAAGYNSGTLFLLPANGQRWSTIVMENPIFSMNTLILNDSNVYIGYKDGVYYSPLSEIQTAVKSRTDIVPATYSLQQNYPNPFNPTTTINYSVPKSGLVKIKVYDLLGREVASLVNENKPVGNYSIEFNAGKLTSGIYFYRMESGSFSHTKKLLLVK